MVQCEAGSGSASMAPLAKGCDCPLLGAAEDVAGHKEARIKCVLVGDRAVGKTSLVVAYSTNSFQPEYVPTAYDNFSVLVKVDGQPYSVQLCDTAGLDSLDPLRALCYPDADVFLLVFSVVQPSSLSSLMSRWLPEVRQHCPDAATILVGTQGDRRSDAALLKQMAAHGSFPVAPEEAAASARRLGAAAYVETSALTQRDLKEAFDQAIVCALRRRGQIGTRRVHGGGNKVWKRLCCWRGSDN